MADNLSEAPALADQINLVGNADAAVDTADDLAESSADTDVEQLAQDANTKVAGLIAMHRDVPIHEGGPIKADVHPDEVSEWLLHGWQVTSDV